MDGQAPNGRGETFSTSPPRTLKGRGAILGTGLEWRQNPACSIRGAANTAQGLRRRPVCGEQIAMDLPDALLTAEHKQLVVALAQFFAGSQLLGKAG